MTNPWSLWQIFEPLPSSWNKLVPFCTKKMQLWAIFDGANNSKPGKSEGMAEPVYRGEILN